MSGMARAVELLGIRACLAESVMDSGEGLPTTWAARSTDDCIQVEHMLLKLNFLSQCTVLGFGLFCLR